MLLFSPESDSKTIHAAWTCLWFFKLCYAMSLEGNTYEHRFLWGVGPWEIFLLSIFLYFLQIFIKSMFYFITGKNKINKNKQISGCYGERIEWGLHPLASALFQHHIMSRVWQVATGSPARAVPADTQDLLAGSRSHQMPNLEVWQLLNFTKFGFVCLFVCLFATSGYTHTHTHTHMHTREYAF